MGVGQPDRQHPSDTAAVGTAPQPAHPNAAEVFLPPPKPLCLSRRVTARLIGVARSAAWLATQLGDRGVSGVVMTGRGKGLMA